MKTENAPAIRPPKQDLPENVANPFAKTAVEHLAAGAVTIESERATAEVQSRIVIAKRFPRDLEISCAKILEQCKRYDFAEAATFSYPRGKEIVTGPSIRLAEELARCYGNMEYGLRELSNKDGESEMEAYAWDLENNVTSTQRFVVKHRREARNESYALKSERDIYEVTANNGARRMRARIMALIPAEMIDAAVKQCELTIKQGNGTPIDDRRKKMLEKFIELGVTEKMILDYAGKKALKEIDADDITALTGVYQGIKTGAFNKEAYFGAPEITKPTEKAETKPATPKKEKNPATTKSEAAPAAPAAPVPDLPFSEPAPAQAEAAEPDPDDEFGDL